MPAHDDLARSLLESFQGTSSGIARAFPGGRLAHPEGQNEEENSKVWGKIYQNLRKKLGKWNSCPPGTVRLAMALGNSASGLPKPMKIVTRSSCCKLKHLRSLSMYNLPLAFLSMPATWTLHLRLSLILTPRILATYTSWRGMFEIVSGGSCRLMRLFIRNDTF